MQYIAKPIPVQAHEIAEVVHVVKTGKKVTYLVLEGAPGRVKVSQSMMYRLSPKRGDFLVYDNQDEPQILAKETFQYRFQEANAL